MKCIWAQFQNGSWPGNKSVTVKYELNIHQQIWDKSEKACALNEIYFLLEWNFTEKGSLKSCIDFQEYNSFFVTFLGVKLNSSQLPDHA